MMWCCVTYNNPKYDYQISDGTVKKRNYIYILKITMKDALNWYGFDSKNIYFKQFKDSKDTVKITKQWLKVKNFKSN